MAAQLAMDMERIARDAEAHHAECIRKLRAKYPVDYPRALEAADALRVHLRLPMGTKATCGERDAQPYWLAGLSGNVDPCGRPYVHVSLSQWPAAGGLRQSTAPDGEVPELPKKILGVPVFVSVAGCFGEKTPGHNGVPCVDKPDPAPSIYYGWLTEAHKRFAATFGDRPWFLASRLAARPVGAIGPNVIEVVVRDDMVDQARVELPKDLKFDDATVVPLVKSRLTFRVEELKKAVDSQLGDLGELSCVDGDDASLPSGRAWVRLVRDGDFGALGSVIAHTGLRATLIGAGLWAVGARRGTIVRDAVAGSLGVDAFILAWSLCRR